MGVHGRECVSLWYNWLSPRSNSVSPFKLTGCIASGKIVRVHKAVGWEISTSTRNYGIQEKLGLPSVIGILTFASRCE